jgi:hypothetical protein
MPIFDEEPTSWTDLQNRVGQMFLELGCEVGIGTTVALVRGAKEIDVLVGDPHTAPPSEYLCECKYWARPIPQEIVHSFRTVVGDRGAHRGFIISKVGFQSGAFEAVRNTNLTLVTFTELQGIFFDRWLMAMGQRFEPYADELFPYWDFGGKRPPPGWTQDDANRLHLLTEAYHPLLMVGPWERIRGYRWEGRLPTTIPVVDDAIVQVGTLTLTTYRELYDFMERVKEEARARFRRLFREPEEVARDA